MFWCGTREFSKSNFGCLKGHSHSGFLDLFLYIPYHIKAYIFVLPHPKKRHPRLTVFHFLIFFFTKISLEEMTNYWKALKQSSLNKQTNWPCPCKRKSNNYAKTCLEYSMTEFLPNSKIISFNPILPGHYSPPYFFAFGLPKD